jgi:hypothetical protein
VRSVDGEIMYKEEVTEGEADGIGLGIIHTYLAT